jgi:RNA polymerase sigma-70 factor (ECF subfamily)
MTDRELLDRYVSEGSNPAFAEIVERHGRMVYLACLRVLGDAASAEDAAQAAFLVLSTTAGRAERSGNLAGWLHVTAANVARTMRDKRARRTRHEREAGKMLSEKKRSADGEGLRSELDLVLASLGRKQRDAIVLRYLEGRSEKEVAGQLGCPRSTAATWIAGGLERLRLALARRGFVVPSAALAGVLVEWGSEPMPAGLAATMTAVCTGSTAASAAATAAAKSAMAAAKFAQLKLASLVLGAVIVAGGAVTLTGLATSPPSDLKDDPAIIASISALRAGSSLRLPEAVVLGPETPPESTPMREAYRAGPGRRNSRMLYVPERRSALHCGTDDSMMFFANDVWEYSLGANAWRPVTPSDGGDHRQLTLAQARVRQGKNPEKYRRFAREWYRQHLEFADGHLRTRGNGGPLLPDVIYDGITYDPDSRRLFWVIGGGHGDHKHIPAFAEATGRDPEELKRARVRGTSLWSFDAAGGRWRRHPGSQPRPLTAGIAGTLQYDSRRNRIVWYYATTWRASEMWAYDPASGTWTNLKPNGGTDLRKLVASGIAPPEELQAAYGRRHDAIVAVHKSGTWVYDCAANQWRSAAANTGGRGRYVETVFAYDSRAGEFLLADPGKGTLRAYDPAADKWKELGVNGPAMSKKGCAGYYDPRLNVLVLYDGSLRTWVYRNRE